MVGPYIANYETNKERRRSKETIITLNSYYDDLELALQQEKLMVEKEMTKPSATYHSTINLP
ncbi:hypothetical protein X798_06942, partial [Onchocerca flexuosa]